MKKVHGIVLICAMILGSCQEAPQVEKPPLNIQQMSLVVQELRIMEAAYGMHYQQIDSLKTGWKPFHNEVFKRNGVTEEDFQKSVSYFSQFPDSLMKMDSLIIARLEPLSRQGVRPLGPGQKNVPKNKAAINQKSGQ
ncbi:MAG: hypothetical protein RL062_337 [Bacteroidota bacterium]|jgi:hypothetical protein